MGRNKEGQQRQYLQVWIRKASEGSRARVEHERKTSQALASTGQEVGGGVGTRVGRKRIDLHAR